MNVDNLAKSIAPSIIRQSGLHQINMTTEEKVCMEEVDLAPLVPSFSPASLSTPVPPPPTR